jgi:hypothetical protein
LSVKLVLLEVIPIEGDVPNGRIASKPSGLELGTRTIPVSPVTPFKVRPVAVPRIRTTAFAPEGGERAVKAEAASVTVSRLPFVPAPGAHRTMVGGWFNSSPSTLLTETSCFNVTMLAILISFYWPR